MKPIIYVAASGQEPYYVEKLHEHYQILHPGFLYENFKDAPQHNNQYEQAISTDFYGICKSHVLVYDVESSPGPHFIAFAFSRNIPVIAVSQNLISPGPYWSLAVDFIVKPSQLLGHLKAVSRDLEEKRLAEEKRNNDIIASRSLQPQDP